MPSTIYRHVPALDQEHYNRLVERWNGLTFAERERGTTDCIHAGQHHWATFTTPGYRLCLHCLRYEPTHREPAS